MKIVKRTLILCFALISLNVVANDKEKEREKNSAASETETKVIIEPVNSQSVYRLLYQSKKAGLVKVSIYNENGVLLMEDYIANESRFVRPYNFSEMPFGTYTLRITEAQETITKQIYHGAQTLVESQKSDVAKVSVVAKEAQKFELSVLGNNNGPVLLTIYNESGKIIFQDNIQETGSYRKQYNLSKLMIGRYSFDVQSAGKIQSFTF